MYGYNLGLAKARVSESVPAAPANVVLPSLVGNGAVGSVVTCSPGAWSGSPSPTFTFNFKLDTVSVQSGASNTYTPLIGDDTKTLTCTVTATNTEGSANADTSNSLVIGTAPSNTVAPVISGTNTFGSTLTTTNGTFTGTATLTYSYQWRKGGLPISGQTAQTYVIGASDSLAAITCEVKATNTYGFDSEVSNTITVQDFAPINTVAPTVSPSGTQSVGTLITANVGTWTGVAPITYEYKWTRNGVAISGATASTYTIQLADDGTTIRVEVKGTNAYGVSGFIASSNSVSAVNTVSPTNTVAPVISGTAVVGQVLTSTTGTWDGIPTPTYSYQWKRGATNIGTNATTYTLVEADAGNTSNITCVVTATNAAGSANATSNQIAQILDATWNDFKTTLSITDTTINSAMNTYTITRKSISATTSIASYPIVGNTATTQSRNLYNPANTDLAKRITWSGSLTHSSTGVLGNGTNGIGNTFINNTNDFPTTNFTVIWYSRTNNSDGSCDFGSNDNNGGMLFIPKFSGTTCYDASLSNFGNNGNIITNTSGCFCLKRSGNTVTLTRNGVNIYTKTETTTNKYNSNIRILGRFLNNSVEQFFSTREYTHFEFINFALDSTQETNLANAVIAKETALSRNV